jgi:hypothetical protein
MRRSPVHDAPAEVQPSPHGASFVRDVDAAMADDRLVIVGSAEGEEGSGPVSFVLSGPVDA